MYALSQESAAHRRLGDATGVIDTGCRAAALMGRWRIPSAAAVPPARRTNAKTGRRTEFESARSSRPRATAQSGHRHRPTSALNNETLFRRDGHLCMYCGQRFSSSQLSRDHVTPLVARGRDAWNNVVTACRRCNNMKAWRTPEQAKLQLIAIPFTRANAEYIYLKAGACSPTRWNTCSRTSRARARCTSGCRLSRQRRRKKGKRGKGRSLFKKKGDRPLFPVPFSGEPRPSAAHRMPGRPRRGRPQPALGLEAVSAVERDRRLVVLAHTSSTRVMPVRPRSSVVASSAVPMPAPRSSGDAHAERTASGAASRAPCA